jgi:hypothetical protein
MSKSSDRHYARMADEISHDHEVTSKYKDRLFTSEGATGRAANLTPGFNRFRPHESRIPVRNVTGKLVWCTPIQVRVKEAADRMTGQKVSATIIAASLGVATSTVTRALLFLAAWKLVAYDTERGRHGGITFLSMAWADLKQRARTAWARMQQDRVRAWDRYVAKLDKSLYFWSGLNVATSESVVATLTVGA